MRARGRRADILPAVSAPDPLLAVRLAGVALRNPVMLAAGTAGTLDEMHDVLDLGKVGAVVTKSLTREPREGNAPWRILPTDAGMLNAIGLANIGVQAFVDLVAPRIPRVPTTVIASVAGFSIEDYTVAAALLGEVEALPAVELNVSCPNVEHGCEFGVEPALLARLVAAVRPLLPRTRLFVKLSPVAVGRPGIVAIARAAIEPASAGAPTVAGGPDGRPGADALCLANTTPAMAIDVHSRRPLLANVTGGLSGPAVHQIAVKLVHDVYRGVARDAGVPLIGIGGVMRWQHAAEFILAGAAAVQMGTALFADPRSPARVVKGLHAWAKEQRVQSISELVGQVDLAPHPQPP